MIATSFNRSDDGCASRHKLFSTLVNCICAVIIATAAYFYLFERPFLTYQNLPFSLTRPVVSPGEVVPLLVNRCNTASTIKNYNTSHTLQEVHTRTYYVLSDQQVSLAPGCTVSTSMINVLPTAIPPGRYKLFGTAEVHGVLRTHYVDWYSEEFDVVLKPQ
jgi:hypothetical protein